MHRTLTAAPTRATRSAPFAVGDLVVPVFDTDLDPADCSGPGTIVEVRGLAVWVRHGDGTTVPWTVFEVESAAVPAYGLPVAA